MYRAGREHQNADGLSRLPLSEKGVETPAEEERMLLLDENDVSLIKAERVKKWTDTDPVLARVREYVLIGWPKSLEDPAFGAYLKKQDELSVQGGCVLWGARVVIPPPPRPCSHTQSDTQWPPRHNQNEGVDTELCVVAPDGCCCGRNGKSVCRMSGEQEHP